MPHDDGAFDGRDERDADVSTIVVRGKRDRPSYSSETTTGSKIAENPREIPQTVANITRQRIEDQNIRTNQEALRQIPGVTATSREGAIALRGFDASTAIDGVPAGSITGRTDADIEVFERIEVLKGAAGLLQGNGQPGGVVNYVFKKPRDTFGASANIGGGSFDTLYGGVDIWGPLTQDRSLRARAVGFFDDRNLYTRPEKRKRYSLYGSVQYDLLPDTTVAIGYYRQDNRAVQSFRQGLPTYADGTLLDVPPRTSLTQDWSHWRQTTDWWMGDVEHRFGGDWVGRVSYRRGRSQLPAIYSGPGATRNYGRGGDDAPSTPSACPENVRYSSNVTTGPGGSLGCFHTEFYNDQTGSDNYDGFLAGSFRLLGAHHKLLIGYNERNERFARTLGAASAAYDFVNDVLAPDPHVIDEPPVQIPAGQGRYTITKDRGIYGRLTLGLSPWLKIPVGARVAWVSEAGTSLAKGKIIPYGGIIADLSRDVSLYGSYAQIFTPATASALIVTRTNADNTLETMRPPPVTGTQYEVGAKATLFDGHADAAIGLYEIRQKNRLSDDLGHQTPAYTYFILSGLTRSRGIEAQVNGEVLRGLDLSAAYTFTDSVFLRDASFQGQTQANVPRHAFNIYTNYRVRSGDLAGLSIGGGVRYQSRIEGTNVTRPGGGACDAGGAPSGDCPPPRVHAPGYAVASLRAGYAFGRNLNLAVNVDNLFDHRYWEELGDTSTGNYLASPRTILVTLRASY